MPGSYDSTGVEISTRFEPIPEGEYTLRIIRATSGETQNGHPKVTVDFEVAGGGPNSGREIRFHTVTFLPKESKGAGMALHFLKTIGEPFEGKFKWDERKWIGKELRAQVVLEPGMKDPSKKYNRVKSVMPKDEAEVDKDLPPDDDAPF